MTASQLAELLGIIGQIAAAIMAVAAAVLAFMFIRRAQQAHMPVDDQTLLSELLTGEQRRAVLPADEYERLSPADRQYILLKQYHSQSLAQSRVSFWFSLVFAAIGFLFITTTVLAIDREAQFTEQGRAFASLAAGTIIEFVSGVFFVQSNRSQQLMVAFFDRLRADRKLEESLSLAEQVDDVDIQNRLKVLLALNFADARPSDDFIASLLNLKMKPKKDDTREDDANSYPPDFYPPDSYPAHTRTGDAARPNGADAQKAPENRRKRPKSESMS